MVRHYVYLQDIKISFEDVDFYAKMSLIMDTPSRNSKTQQTLISTLNFKLLSELRSRGDRRNIHTVNHSTSCNAQMEMGNTRINPFSFLCGL